MSTTTTNTQPAPLSVSEWTDLRTAWNARPGGLPLPTVARLLATVDAVTAQDMEWRKLTARQAALLERAVSNLAEQDAEILALRRRVADMSGERADA